MLKTDEKDKNCTTRITSKIQLLKKKSAKNGFEVQFL